MPLPNGNHLRPQRLSDIQAIDDGPELMLPLRQQFECGAQPTLSERG